MTTPSEAAWIARGAELGFVAVASDVALVEGVDHPGNPVAVGDLAERVRLLGRALGEGCTVVVAATDLAPDDAERIFGAGAYVLPVAAAYWAMSVEDRLRHVRERIEARVDDLGDRIGRVRASLPGQEPVSDAYAGPNPMLGPEGFADWARSVSGITQR